MPSESIRTSLDAAHLAVPDQQTTSALAQVGLGERARLMDPQPPRHSTTISARSRTPCLSTGVWRITATISSTVGGSAGYT
jgi:hypothetical protein